VELLLFHLELAHHRQHGLGDERRPVAVEQTLEHAPHPVVVGNEAVQALEGPHARQEPVGDR